MNISIDGFYTIYQSPAISPIKHPYKLVFGSPKDYLVLHESDSIKEISKKREMAGDLVVEVVNGILVVSQSTEWLFSWELKNPNCYARKAQSEGWTW